MARWTTHDSAELYGVPAWGLGTFEVDPEGQLVMRADPQRAIALPVLVADLRRRGISLPVLVRFTDLIRGRIDALAEAFGEAIEGYAYQGVYRGVYPIKVNPERYLLEAVVEASRTHHLGLEAGSKPELQLALAHVDDPDALLVCNGYKDTQYMELGLLARKVGRNVIIVIEKLSELDTVLEAADRLSIDPVLGVRARLSFTGAGKWKASSGDHAKFGLTVQEIVELVHRLRERNRLGTLRLLHYHIGSQVSAIRSIKNALREATRLYTELVRIGAPMGYLDVGGGLGVDYDGSRTDFASSMNYDLHEYAYDVVYAIHDACETAGVPHPDLVTESGRAMVAHSSVLVFDVLGVGSLALDPHRPELPPEGASELVQELWEIYEAVNPRNLQGPYHHAQEIKEESVTRFTLGLSSLEDRAAVERRYWQILRKIAGVARELDYIPEDLEPVRRALADTYYCNFSLFQSAPDAWAIGHLFPILPIHRLGEEPRRRGVLVDITCDSDGKIDRFIDRRDVKQVLDLHELDGQPYTLGMFLVGAYQEILGDLHNLFGDTNTVHVTAVAGGRGYRIDQVTEGDSVQEVMEYVGYDRRLLLRHLRAGMERAIEAGTLSIEEAARFWDVYLRGLDSYTYLKV